MTEANFEPGTVLGRAKGAMTHVGFVTPSGRILHNTLEKGEHESTLEEFAANEKVNLVSKHVITEATLARVSAILQKPSQHSLLNNCEDTVSKIVHGKSGSQYRKETLRTFGTVAFFATGFGALVLLAAAAIKSRRTKV